MADLTCGEVCLKYLLIIFNFVFWAAGMAVMAVGLWLRFDTRTASLFTDSSTVFFTGVYIMVAAGFLMMVVGFLGCCGALKESQCMLGWFFSFLIVICVGEVAVGIWGFSNGAKVVKEATEFYMQTYNEYQKKNQTSGLKEILRSIHFGMNCCGPKGSESEVKEICPDVTKSCTEAFEEFFSSKLYIIGGVGFCVGIMMIFGMVFSMRLCCAILKDD